MKDYLVRAIARKGKVRAFAIRSTNLVEECRKRLDTWPVASAALGRAVTASAVMGAMLKGKERLTVQVKGGGPIGQIVADAGANGEARGFVSNPHVNFPLNSKGKLDVARAVGTDGFLTVTKDLGLKDPYHGSVELISGELGEDFTYYFARSEQTPSAVSVGVLVNPDYSIKASGGFVIQLLPGMKEDEITEIEQLLSEVPPVSSMIDEGLTPEEIITKVLGEDDVEILSHLDISFNCHCSLQRVENTLVSLGRAELESIIKEQGEAEVVCHFCNERYVVDRPRLEQLVSGTLG
ncbi:Hsp33 family molecular chaperone [Ammoniphilus oxalaticus]|uniref:33 kDa chaperonin n=1 Tax=Ammoniphilus oxalaticus TaxID=66863 RepID=A0A419SG71_9BACL|nr:Hsp33 family molecular chaperone HslO [Ammoniphilus oxalaticus]RKD22778.1 Hsp33 family molecular chaperone [Ammoniphilus oxalaticus]